ncbi:MAG TPA: DUF427 domain-containing protein [Mycobacteriales bacterium]|nr:DUF427 domain-containing protein [Mycobacteriales bacterium]
MPDGPIVYIEPHPRRVEAVIDNDVVLRTEQALLVHRPGHMLAFAFPEDVVGDLPSAPVPEAPGFVQVPWDAVDTWFEEGRRLVHYPPNPYHRADARPTTRRLRVTSGDAVLVDTDDTIIVFETSLEPVLYVRREHVRVPLRRSETTSWCNYKGRATYWSAVIGEQVVDDAAWSYDEPLAESAALRGALSFDLERVHVEAELPVGAAGASPRSGESGEPL